MRDSHAEALLLAREHRVLLNFHLSSAIYWRNQAALLRDPVRRRHARAFMREAARSWRLVWEVL